jgi:RNA polymerase sigma factor (sigma-70 family)
LWRFNNILSLSANDRGVARELVDAREDGPPNRLIRSELGQTLGERIEECLRAVNRRWREILERRFGLGGREPQTLQEIADIFGLTRERVRQIENKILEKLRGKRLLCRLREIICEENRA